MSKTAKKAVNSPQRVGPALSFSSGWPGLGLVPLRVITHPHFSSLHGVQQSLCGDSCHRAQPFSPACVESQAKCLLVPCENVPARRLQAWSDLCEAKPKSHVAGRRSVDNNVHCDIFLKVDET